MSSGGSGSKISNNLAALSSAAVLTVYAAGYLRTRAAADRLDESSIQRRAAAPIQVVREQVIAPTDHGSLGLPTTAVERAAPSVEGPTRDQARLRLDPGVAVRTEPAPATASSSAATTPPAAAPIAAEVPSNSTTVATPPVAV